MYKCTSCGASFSEPNIVHDTVPYGAGYTKGPAQECCPYCGGNFEKAKICELCGNAYIDSNHDSVCKRCISIVAKRFSELLKTNFTPFEISIINSAYDGRNLE